MRRYKEMKILGQIINAGKKISTSLVLNRVNAIQTQKRTLKKLLLRAEYTAFGKEYKFSEIIHAKDVYESFIAHVPISDYSKMYPWWQRAYKGEANVAWPGKIDYFALSSGTSEGSSKYIPVSEDMLKSIRRAGLRQILSIAKTDLPKDFLTKHYLMIGGSTDLYYDGNVYSGDLSGITTQNVPYWFERFSKPSMEIRSRRNWQDKINSITIEASKWDVVMIAGVPAWIQLLLENIIAHYKLNNIHDLWPNFSVFIHGGVSIDPYKKGLSNIFGKPIMYFETYLASEGFIAFQNKLDSGGMRLVFRNGMFYEFIPFNKDNFNESGELKENPEVVNIDRVIEGQEYAILITTCAGAWRYLIGDVIKFINIEDCLIKITGRTKHFLSLCGEHLSVENMNAAVEMLADEFDCSISEFTVKGEHYEGMFAHRWFLGVDGNTPDKEGVKKRLDEILSHLNDDYATERKHALKEIFVEIIPVNIFIDWMASKNKMGSQNKFPRVLTDTLYEDWKKFVQEQTSQKKN